MLGRVLLLAIGTALTVGCSSPPTQVKYVYHWAGQTLKVPDGTVHSAPANKHYAVFLINCIDNSSGNDGFVYNSGKLRDEDGNPTQDNPVTDQYVGVTVKIVNAGKMETNLGKVVFLLPGPPQTLQAYYLSYASDETESVLMVSQTVAALIQNDPNIPSDLADMNSSPFFPKGTECGEMPPYHPEK
jgi:hypothetical protein